MTKVRKEEQKKVGKPTTNAPVVQQFASGGSAMPTPVVPYDVEKVQGGKVKPAPKPVKE